ncbi:MAG: hypothetical protein QF793_04015, partial [Candidatus Peribacteraceae bacterium]|nr:hypothetical protein [Candidatus Peribacteraceae bacterium]
VPDNLHLVDRFGDDNETIQDPDNPSAATIIEMFHHNPTDYWKEIGILPSQWENYDTLDDTDRVLVDKLKMSYGSMTETFAERGIRFPKWLSKYNPEHVLAS